jgi:hypothetical protein
MTDETEMQNGMQQLVPKWESKVVCLAGVSPWALAKKVNDVYSDGKWVVGTQVFRDGEQWVACQVVCVHLRCLESSPVCGTTESRQRTFLLIRFEHRWRLST